MTRDYRLYELNDGEFERLVVRICIKWLGPGVTPFATGKDGGRDGKFNGTACSFPSPSSPWSGHCVIQAKHVSAPDRSCSDTEFETLLKKEHPKITRLIGEGICTHYLVFTNRKLTGGADETHTKALRGLGLVDAQIIGLERLSLALEEHIDIKDTLPNINDEPIFRFNPTDMVEVIGAVHDCLESSSDGFDSAHDFDLIRIQEKNKINGVSSDYYQQIIINGSMPYFKDVKAFLENPRNREYADLYHDTADELKQKILAKRAEFDRFDDVFAFIYEQVQRQRDALRGKRRLISILLHYMYCNCDIGSKKSPDDCPAHA